MKINVTIEIDDRELKKLLKEAITKDESSANKFDCNYSEYARLFDDSCSGWTKDSEYNLNFLINQERYFNGILISKGHLFLNEVYDALGIPRTKAGNIVGWVYNEENPIGDNHVDFGIYDLLDERKRAFVNGYSNTIILDFNVDGSILEYI